MSYEEIRNHIQRLEHDLYYLMDFIGENGLWQEAKDHLEEHESDAIPFGFWVIQESSHACS
mgnify:CR=1 FL=1